MASVKRKWQNLIDRRCPDCYSEFEENPNGFKCPNPTCGFFLTRKKVIEILTDKTHSAVRFADTKQRKILDNALRELSKDPKGFWQSREKVIESEQHGSLTTS